MLCWHQELPRDPSKAANSLFLWRKVLTAHQHNRPNTITAANSKRRKWKKAQWNNASLNLFIKYLRSRSSKGGSSCYTICDGEMHAAFGDWRRSCIHRLSARACLSFDANSLYVFFYKATDSLLFQITHFHNNTTEILTATEVCESQRAWRFPW